MNLTKTLALNIEKWNELKCKIFHQHDYRLLKSYRGNILKVECKHCKKHFGADLDKGLLMTWNERMEFFLGYHEQIS